MHPHRHTVKDLAPSLLGCGPASDVITHKNHTYLPKALTRAQRSRRQSQSAARVFARDGHQCRKCGRHASRYVLEGGAYLSDLTVDHIIPQSCGGTDDLFNLTTLCRPCNTRRGAYLPDPVTLL
jgi:5-methylcytosine-specific restriction endonuclease McrA